MIFISHKSDPDHQYALQIATKLQDNGINCWIAPESIKHGEDFSVLVPQAINCCEIFILILTKDTASSDHVRKELTLAIKHRKAIVPLVIGEFDVDDSYDYLLANIQKVHFNFTESDFENLVDKCKVGEQRIEIEISKNPSRSINLLKGDFQENMDTLLKSNPEDFEKTVFAMGIDSSSRLDISSNKGIVKWVCKYLNEEHNISIDTLQMYINKAKEEQLGHKGPDEPLNYKDCVTIQVPLQTDNRTISLNLLFIANSRKNSNYELSHDVDDVEGIDSREIIMAVFNKCREFRPGLTNLFIGAMGTNGLNCPYEVVVSEIINCYVYAQRLNSEPHNLYFSMRKEDMLRAELSVDDIMTYITTIVNFIK
ncbi:MAG: toll/interleukin-1 receptor domain-containing protein [Saccharofermentans sp.]|nr:toll/interleukin-1 receptor domain-containing protein [Saccharofermentans sp.]